jgi:hypothetical protein
MAAHTMAMLLDLAFGSAMVVFFFEVDGLSMYYSYIDKTATIGLEKEKQLKLNVTFLLQSLVWCRTVQMRSIQENNPPGIRRHCR